MQIHEIGKISQGVDRTGFQVQFPDGSKLIVYAKVKLPPLIEMTPRPVYRLDTATGLTISGDDKGLGEAIELSEMAQAVIEVRKLETKYYHLNI